MDEHDEDDGAFPVALTVAGVFWVIHGVTWVALGVLPIVLAVWSGGPLGSGAEIPCGLMVFVPVGWYVTAAGRRTVRGDAGDPAAYGFLSVLLGVVFLGLFAATIWFDFPPEVQWVTGGLGSNLLAAGVLAIYSRRAYSAWWRKRVRPDGEQNAGRNDAP